MGMFEAQLHRAKILIIDDEKFNLVTLNSALSAEYDIMVAPSGEVGLKAAVRGRPDLILLDITMPDMDGYDVLKVLREDPLTNGIPVIFITGMDSAEEEAYGLELGAQDYITKPFNMTVVKARVKSQIRLKKQSDLLAGIAFKDGLTGLANRRSFDERLLKEWNRCKRTEQVVSLIFMDIDHFKLYNDTYGHARGDDCLRCVAEAIDIEVRRASELSSRYGGEEFVILMPEAPAQAARQMAERIQARIQGLCIPHKTSPTSEFVSSSMGFASMVPPRDEEAGILIEAADEQLYKAKEAGRNRICGQDEEAAPAAVVRLV